MLETTEADFDRLLGVNSKGVFFTLQNAARHVVDNGRIIYVGSSATAFAIPGLGLYSGSKMAPRLWVEVLAKEIGHRGVTVNSILPTGIEGAGVFTELPSDDPLRRMVIANSPRGRMGTVQDVADAAEYLASQLSSFVSGQHLLVTGGASY
jgi:3-oxoacyl-[acyl-carrier protein] reductase